MAEQSGYFAAEVRKTKQPLPAGAKVLEVGFGKGRFLAYARSQQWQVTGTELNPHLALRGKAIGQDVQHTQDLAQWADGSFDLVVALDVLEHVPPSEALAFLRALFRVLRPGDCVLLRFPNADSPFGLAHQNADVTHLNAIGHGTVLYWAHVLQANVLALRGQAQPVWGVGPVLTLYRLAVWPVRTLLNLWVRVFFLGGAPIDYSAANIVAVLRKTG